MGDWNAKVGKGETMNGVMGPYGIGERNENGEKLIEFAGSNDLKIANTLFDKKEKFKWTWMSPDSRTKNEIDHFLIIDSRIVQNIVCLSNFNFSQDHGIVRCSLKIMDRIKYKNYRRSSAKATIKSIIPEQSMRKANEFVKEQISINTGENKVGVQSYYNKIEQAIRATLEKFGKEGINIKTDDKITEKTKNLIHERKKEK